MTPTDRVDAHALTFALRFANSEAVRLREDVSVWRVSSGVYKVLPADHQGPVNARRVATATPP